MSRSSVAWSPTYRSNRDPETDRVVIADYKTDRPLPAERAEERTQAYRRQGAVYQEALQQGLGLSYRPRFELWYLRADEIRA